jgi:MFS-type transporter involved in bile tolerance (Atg22 family)
MTSLFTQYVLCCCLVLISVYPLIHFQLAMINAGAFPGRIILNMLADKIGPLNVIWPSSLVCTILLFALFSITKSAGIMVFAVLYGFFSGAGKRWALSEPSVVVKLM